jgi:acyl carrier protein
MNLNDVLAKVQNIFIDIFEDDYIQLKYETTANDIEEWDSLTHIQIIVELEKQFGIKFKLAEVQGFKNVGEMCENILGKLR